MVLNAIVPFFAAACTISHFRGAVKCVLGICLFHLDCLYPSRIGSGVISLSVSQFLDT